MPQGPKISPDVRALIANAALRDYFNPRDKVASAITKELEGRGKTVPAYETLLKEISKARNSGDEQDRPWSLGVAEKFGISMDATKDVLAVWRLSLLRGEPLSVREAKWVARLRSAIPDTHSLLRLAILYARHERNYLSKQVPLDTTDLDGELAFRLWEQPFGMWEYGAAVQTGTVPEPWQNKFSKKENLSGRLLTEFYDAFGHPFMHAYSAHAITALYEFAGEDAHTTRCWESAVDVLTMWLRKYASEHPKWRLIGHGSDEEVGEEALRAWRGLVRSLAHQVWKRAKELRAKKYEWGVWHPHPVEQPDDLCPTTGSQVEQPAPPVHADRVCAMWQRRIAETRKWKDMSQAERQETVAKLRWEVKVWAYKTAHNTESPYNAQVDLMTFLKEFGLDHWK